MRLKEAGRSEVVCIVMDPRERTRGGGRREPCRVVVDALVVLVHVLRIVAFDGANRVLVAVLLEGELDEEGRQEAEQGRETGPVTTFFV